eukprot:Nk52_evm35s2612 gene=Nk52_evmTU35s2612
MSADEFDLPKSVLQRIVNDALPEGINVGKDARLAILKGSGVFVSYLTAMANDCAQQTKKRTIGADEVLKAIEDIEFGHFKPVLEGALEEFREEQKNKKEKARLQTAEKRKMNKKAEEAEKENMDTADGNSSPKKQKVEEAMPLEKDAEGMEDDASK